MARTKTTTPQMDYGLVLVVSILTVFGLMMIFSTTYYLSLSADKPSYYYFGRQLAFTAIGVAAMIFLSRVEYHKWKKLSGWLLAISLILVIGVLAIGNSSFGAQRWFTKSGSGQPSELLKLALIIYLAHWLASRKENIKTLSLGLIPFAILMGIASGLVVLQDDLSTSALIAITSFVMFFIAGGEIFQMIASLGIGGAVVAFLIYQEPYRLQRITAFGKNPFANPTMQNWQIRQTLEALGNGGVLGVGLGQSPHKIAGIPAVHTDVVFAVVGEEMGFLGALLLIGLFAFLAYRGMKIALNAPDVFGTLLAAGITSSIILQALINTAVVTNTIPFTGIPLPFISSGGSSMVVSMASIGLLLAISRRTLPEEPAEQTQSYEIDDFGRRQRRTRVPRTRRGADT